MAKLTRQPRASIGRDLSIEDHNPAVSSQSDRRRTLTDAQVAEGMNMTQSKRAITAARFIHSATGEWPWEFAADFRPRAWSINMLEHLSQLTRHVKTDVGGFEPVKSFFRSVIHQKRIDEKPNQNLKAGDVIDAMVRFKVPNKARAKAEGRARKTKAKKQINSREEEESDIEKDDQELGDVEEDESDVEEGEEDEGNKVSAETNQKNEMDEDSREETEGNEHQENDTDALVPRRHKSLDKVVPAPQLQSTPVKTTNEADKKRTAGSHAFGISKRRRIREQEAPASPVS